MPQETNLNVSPYFDDFEENKNYYKVLFKPEYPIQARELTTLQTILQNQIENHGKNIFKEGSVVIPGQVRYESPYHAVEINSVYNGISLSVYFSELIGKKIQGLTSGVTAEIVNILTDSESERGSYTLYVRYLGSGGVDFTIKRFQDSETLILQTAFTYNGLIFQSGQGFCTTKATNSISEGSSASVASGVYFVRGYFVNVDAQTIILDQYNNSPSYRVGFNVIEQIVTSDEDETLFDNAKSFSNYSAPGADRFQLRLQLSKRFIDDTDTQNFVDLFKVVNGIPEFSNKNIQYNLIRDELARRTSDVSGDFIVRPFSLTINDSLNDRLLNRGLFFDDQLTANGNTPSEDLMVYQIGAGKAYVNGYEIETATSRFIDVPKPRTTNVVENDVISFNAGIFCPVNNSFGTPNIGIGTTSLVKLMDSRIGGIPHQQSGTEIGMARIYDFVPESNYENDTSVLNLRLFDIETYTFITLTNEITLNAPAIIKGKRSKARGYLKENVTNSKTLKLYGVSGSFSENESISINDIDNSRLIASVVDYDLNDIKSLYTTVGITTFNADVLLSKKTYILPQGTQFNVNNGTVSAGIDKNFLGKIKVGDIVSYTNVSGDPYYNKVTSIGSGGTTFTISGITTVSGVCDGNLAAGSFNISNIVKITNTFLDSDSALFTQLNRKNVNSVSILESEIIQRRIFTSQTVLSNGSLVIDIDPLEKDVYFDSFDEDKFVVTYLDGSLEPIRADKFALSNLNKRLTIRGLSKTSGLANVIATVVNKAPSSKIKKFNKVSTLLVSNSKYTSSGIGTTTLNDGLSYSNVYGTRVQDEEICLNVPDAVRILAIYESSGINDPQIPRIQLNSFSGPSNNNLDYVIGERIQGKTSGAVGIIVNRVDTDKLEFINLNSFSFQIGELIVGDESNINSIIINKNVEDKNITQNFTFDNGQRAHFYDYSRIIRNPQYREPNKKIKIVFQNYTIDSSDTGEFITANSYSADLFKHDIPSFSGTRLTDLIDIRPRVAPYTLSTKSPFEFDSRIFSSDGQYSQYILAPGENISLSYSYYQGRIDLISLKTDGSFEVTQGSPSDEPIAPQRKANSLDIAYVYIPSYVFNVNSVRYIMAKHKNYTMSDISLLEDRIDRVERFTTLTDLENQINGISIRDPETNLEKFKSGFFADDFKSHNSHNASSEYFSASIDAENGVLRPKHYTTSIDLTFDNSLISNAVKTGNLITLAYNEFLYDRQIYATKTESVTPYLINFWLGNVSLMPSSDSWTDDRTIEITDTTRSNIITRNFYDQSGSNLLGKRIEISLPQVGSTPINYLSNIRNFMRSQFGVNGTSGYLRLPNGSISGYLLDNTSSISLSSSNKASSQQLLDILNNNNLVSADIANTFISELNGDPRGAKLTVRNNSAIIEIGRTGPSAVVSQQSSNITSLVRSESSTVSLVGNLRKRNIQFSANNLKPFTKFYPYFGGLSVKNYVNPKFLQIQITNDKTFISNENVTSEDTTKFKSKILSQSTNTIEIDTESLSDMSQDYYGKADVGMKLIGETSGAEARVISVDLFSDAIGSLVGTLFIPDPTIPENPKWSSDDTNIFTLVDSENLNFGVDSRADSSPFTFTLSQTTTTNFVTNSTTVNTITSNITDPLAQSFFVSEKTGVFLTSVEVFFSKKPTDADSKPVILQIRPMISGLPSTQIIPFSEVVLNASDVNISSDSSVPTKFTFPSPVYLSGPTENNLTGSNVVSQSNVEYAIVLLSNDTNYRVFISELGKRDLLLENTIVSTQPTLGSLFKSQNASTWTPSQLEDLKYNIYRADFVTQQGLVRFTNTPLSRANEKITRSSENSITTISKKVIAGLGSTGYNPNLIVPGISLVQGNATGTLTGIAGSIRIGTGVTIVNSGTGYTGAGTTFTNVNLITETGFGSGAIVDIDIDAITTGIGTVKVVNGGSGYQIGDSLIVPEIGSGVGYGGKVSVLSIGSSNSFVIDNIQGSFSAGISTLYYINSAGITTEVGPGVRISEIQPDQYYTGNYIKVNHLNHGMHSNKNYLRVSKFLPGINEAISTLSGDITSTVTLIPVESGIGFTQFEGKPVNSSNIGYLLVNNEIIGYTSVNGNILESSDSLRGVDSDRNIEASSPSSHSSGSVVYKYELEGVSLRRINKTHNLALVNQETHPTDINSYHIKIEMADSDYNSLGIGSDRSNNLFFKQTSQVGNAGINLTNNIQFEEITPVFGKLELSDTNISARIRTTTGTSISGNELSFEDSGYEDVVLNDRNYLNTPRLIASDINEFEFLDEFPNNRSLVFDLLLSSNDSLISPVINASSASAIITSNLINNPIGIGDNEGYANDESVRSLDRDKHSCVYLSNPIRLALPANSLTVFLSAMTTTDSDIRVLYQTYRTDSPNRGDTFNLFPGYSNYRIDSNGIKRVINFANNDGSEDYKIEKSDSKIYRNYEYNVDDLPSFDTFIIKIVMSSRNQANPPFIKGLRAIATVKPSV